MYEIPVRPRRRRPILGAPPRHRADVEPKFGLLHVTGKRERHGNFAHTLAEHTLADCSEAVDRYATAVDAMIELA